MTTADPTPMIVVCFHEVCPSSERVRRVGPGGPLVRRPAHLQAGPAGRGHHDLRRGAGPAPRSRRSRRSTRSGRRSSWHRALLDRHHPLPRLFRVRIRHRGLHEALRQGPARPRPRARSPPSGGPTSPTRSVPWPPRGTSSERIRPRPQRLLPRLRGRAPEGRRHRRRLPGRAPLPQEARLRLPRPRGQIRAARGGHRARGARRRRLLRQAAPEVRADALHVRRDVPEVVRLVPQGHAASGSTRSSGSRR